MNDIPASLLIRPSEARERFRTALRELVDVFGYKRVASRVAVNERTLSRWLKDKNKPDYFVAIVLIAWYDRDIKRTDMPDHSSAKDEMTM